MQETNELSRKRNRGIYLLPNLFTVAAMFAGFYAIIAGMHGRFADAVIAIFVAVIADGLDGRVARLTQTQSEFGAQLDSLSDMLSFGVTPAMVLYSWSLSTLGKPGWLVAFLYVVCSALRLARFNTQIGKSDKRYFQGLSVTLAAAFIASLIWVAEIYHVHGKSVAIPLACITVIVGLLKVSSVPYRSFKDFNLRDSVPFVVILIVVVGLVLFWIDPPDILLACTLLYVLSGPFALLMHMRNKRKLKKK